MAGLFVELLLSWILLWFFDKSHLNALGILPSSQRFFDLIFGLICSFLVAGFGLYMVVYISKSSMGINPNFTSSHFFDRLLWMFNSVVYEELIFRGALLYIAISKLGIYKACLISSVAFGIYHWFTFGAWGNILQMAYVFILTGFAGAIFAFSFAYTRSMWLAIGLHLGWNVVSNIVFSQGQSEDQLLIIRGGQKIGNMWSWVYFLYQIAILPIPVFYYLKQSIKKRHDD
ncbi:CPBP family intramembrane glutamic endopeptidase [Aquirufa ecclesiirivi]|uniref:CPBP family intramembrane glutamic endopeptidase n=1 Tax=Aquirufa ecclesiirivi TaxID=2715124 RepID=UPI0022A82893|nr:CPBP family intramembrane glutamic endopeptidase [Aquirufa ecclesiirivi]MCZ2473160.1 CPBP family intramembrane metalloprotease [Aquirufa ecclesiirivi]